MDSGLEQIIDLWVVLLLAAFSPEETPNHDGHQLVSWFFGVFSH